MDSERAQAERSLQYLSSPVTVEACTGAVKVDVEFLCPVLCFFPFLWSSAPPPRPLPRPSPQSVYPLPLLSLSFSPTCFSGVRPRL